VSLIDTPSVVWAQQCIDALLAGHTPRLELYGDHRPGPAQVLGDIYAIARWTLRSLAYPALLGRLPEDIGAALGSGSPGRGVLTRTRSSSTPSVRHAAVGILTALEVLTKPSVSSARALLCDLMLDANGAITMRYGLCSTSKMLSPVAAYVHERAFEIAAMRRRKRRQLALAAAAWERPGLQPLA
jgi:hypothetical protein